MHLRLPLVAGVVALAAAAAILRAHTAAAPAPALAISHAPASAPSATPASPRRAGPTAAGTIVVYVAGDVVRAGIYTLPRTSRAADALRAAGGVRADADLVALNLAARLADGEEVAVFSKDDARAPAHSRSRRSNLGVSASETARPVRRHKKRARKRPAGGADLVVATDAMSDAPTDIIDLNRADASELEMLPGIGAALAERIVAVREASGPYGSPDDLLDVGGMTQGRLDAVLPYVTVR